MRKTMIALALAGMLGWSGFAMAAETPAMPENAQETQFAHHGNHGGRHHNGGTTHRQGCNGGHRGACYVR